MKKSVWGYSIREVESAVEVLESQNTALAKKISRLETELEASRAKISELEEGFLCPAADEENQRQQAQKIQDLENENRQLRDKVGELSKLIKKIEAEKHSKENRPLDVEDICRQAYSDMALAKQNTRRKMEECIEQFMSSWIEMQNKMAQMLEETTTARANACDAFISSAEVILNRYEEMEKEARLFKERMDKAFFENNSIHDELKEVVSKLGDTEDRNEKDEEAESENTSPVIRAIMERSKRQKGISTQPEEKLKLPPEVEIAAANSEEAIKIIDIMVGANPKDIIT